MFPAPAIACSRRARRPAWSVRAGLVALSTTVVLASGCGPTGGPHPADKAPTAVPDLWPAADGRLTSEREGCGILGGTSLPGETFVVGLAAAVDPAHAPVPRNDSERLVFDQLYETLVNVGCDGRPRPGLARQWACTEDSTTWVFTLREGARFWDGTPVTAAAVRQAWTANAGAATDSDETGATASPWSWISARASSISVVDARRLAVQLPEPHGRFPALLAHPAAAVAVQRPGWTWPVGSGPCRLRASDPAPRPDLTCRPNVHHPVPPAWKELTFRVQPGVDLRDFVTGDVDLLVVRDRETVAFFSEAPGFRTDPLPWDRHYVLVCPPEKNPDGGRSWQAAVAGLRPSRDMTAVSGRPWPHVMYPLGGADMCPQLSGPIASARQAPLDSELGRRRLDERTIAYPTGDPAAAELAGRLGHLAGPGTRIAGLEPRDYALALRWQMAGAFVVPQDQLFPTGCLQLATLMGRAVWLQKAGLARPEPRAGENPAEAGHQAGWIPRAPAENLAAAGIVHSLALARRWLVTRGELAGLQLDFDGTPLLAGLGPPDPAATASTPVPERESTP